MMCKGYAFLGIRIGLNMAGIPNEEDDHDNRHWQRVKDIKRPLMRQGVSVISKDVFNDAENRANHNQSTNSV